MDLPSAAPDPRTTLAEAPMSRAQLVAVGLTILLTALDGFDVLAISFASPGIAAEWGIDRAALGLVLSMELVGMAIGSILIGRIADRVGRRPTILACLLVMGLGMFGATSAANIAQLCAWRIFTGLGIGGMLATTNAAVAEYSNARNRSRCAALMANGYPLGVILGGIVAARLLEQGDWRLVFQFGGAATLLCLPLVWFFLPETIPFLCRKQPFGALARINRALGRMGHPPVPALPPSGNASGSEGRGAILGRGMLTTTLLVTFAYFMHIATFYFLVKWVPKIVVDMGFEASAAARVLVWANVGGAIGGAVLAFFARRVALKPLVLAALGGSVLFVILFGRGQDGLSGLALVAGIAGFFTNAGVVGLYAIFARAFPTRVRASGTGFAIGVGRAGAALSPILAGFLFQSGMGLQVVATVMAAGAAIAALAILALPLPAGTGEAD